MKLNIQDQTNIIVHYGVSSQLGIAQEECAELIQAISKIARGKNNPDGYFELKDHLVEEMADVIVCINQLQQMFDISDKQLEMEINVKINRQLKRIENE